MKSLVFAVLFVVSSAAFASFSYWDEVSSSDCKGKRVTREDVLLCFGANNFNAVNRARVGASISPDSVDFSTQGPIELGVIPDADSNLEYRYMRVLRGTRNQVVGYMQIDGISNSEMEVFYKVTTRYNVDGELVSGKVQE